MAASFGATKGTKSSLCNLCRVQTIPVRLRLSCAHPHLATRQRDPLLLTQVLWPYKTIPNRRCGLSRAQLLRQQGVRSLFNGAGTLVLISLAYLPCARQTTC